MRTPVFTMALASALMLCGCMNAPGRPGPNPEVPRPEQVLDFATLYGRNCAGCHGSSSQPGAAIPLANPVYLSIVGRDNLLRITADGVPGTSMPGFGANSVSMLTNRQVEVIVDGMLKARGPDVKIVRFGFLGSRMVLCWGAETPAPDAPPYAAILKGDAQRGKQAYATYCNRCHGADGKGNGQPGSVVDPAYLSLISDQGLRSFVIAGRPSEIQSEAMPDYRDDLSGHPMTDQDVTDVVAWLSSQRPVK